jgi:hypothetical protein
MWRSKVMMRVGVLLTTGGLFGSLVVLLSCHGGLDRASPPSLSSASLQVGLSDAEVLASAKRALRVMWGHEPDLRHYSLKIQRAGACSADPHDERCEYVLTLDVVGTRDAREAIAIHVDRFGRVKTLPVCCDLGDCPEWCS